MTVKPKSFSISLLLILISFFQFHLLYAGYMGSGSDIDCRFALHNVRCGVNDPNSCKGPCTKAAPQGAVLLAIYCSLEQGSATATFCGCTYDHC